MSETKWTPGPLHVTKDQRREQWGVFSAPTEDASDRLVAVCMREADAALYAAAPALYEALADLLDATTCFNGELINDDERRAARIALAAARGES